MNLPHGASSEARRLAGLTLSPTQWCCIVRHGLSRGFHAARKRRADAMARAMEICGAKTSQMETTSWGKEKPVALGHDEAAWAQNRRAAVVYPTH